MMGLHGPDRLRRVVEFSLANFRPVCDVTATPGEPLDVEVTPTGERHWNFQASIPESAEDDLGLDAETLRARLQQALDEAARDGRE